MHAAEAPRPCANGGGVMICFDTIGFPFKIAQFRLPGANIDYLVLGSDSGRVSVLEYNKSRNQFERVHCAEPSS
jgi:splicing factor 3B subunit 3